MRTWLKDHFAWWWIGAAALAIILVAAQINHHSTVYYCWDTGPPEPHHYGHPVTGDHRCSAAELGKLDPLDGP